MVIDLYWVGHSYCNGTSNEWSCCNNQFGNTDNDELFPFRNDEMCWCPEDNAEIAFAAPSKIPDIAQLDLNEPGEISYFPDATPTAASQTSPPSDDDDDDEDDSDDSSSNPDSDPDSESDNDPSPASTSSDPDSDSNPSEDDQSDEEDGSPGSNPEAEPDKDPSETGGPESPNSNESSSSPAAGLPHGAKIGIGVGAGVGFLVIAALLFFLFRYRRKIRRLPLQPNEEKARPKSANGSSTSPDHTPEGPNGDPRKPMWSGQKSELPTSGPNGFTMSRPSTQVFTGTRPNSISEVDGSPRVSAQSHRPPGVEDDNPQNRTSNALPSQPVYDAHGIRQYEPYNPAGRQPPGRVHEMPA